MNTDKTNTDGEAQTKPRLVLRSFAELLQPACADGEAIITQTNSHGWIACCQCGWIGIVHPSPSKKKRIKEGGTTDTYDNDAGRRLALLEWRQHRDAQGNRREMTSAA